MRGMNEKTLLEKIGSREARLAVIGLGYVGLPLAVEFGKRFAVVGFDVNARRLEELRAGKDRTLEVSGEELALTRTLMVLLTCNLSCTFLTTVFTAFAGANEQFVFQRLLNLGKTLASPLLSIPVLLMGFGSVGMVLVTVLGTDMKLLELPGMAMMLRRVFRRRGHGAPPGRVISAMRHAPRYSKRPLPGSAAS